LVHTAEASLVGARLRLRPDVVSAMNERDLQVLGERGIDMTKVSVPSATKRLSGELQVMDLHLAEATAPLSAADGADHGRPGGT